MWQVIGQDRVVQALQRGLAQGNVAHAYVFVGPQHIGKMTLALDLARALNCEGTEPPCRECSPCQRITLGQHADVQTVGLNGGAAEARQRAEIGIDQIRELQHVANLPPFEGRCRVFIIDGAEQLSLEAANCLLKTLEEPAGGVVFILLTTSDSLLPATVVSRCQRLELGRMAAVDVEAALGNRWGVAPQKAALLARLCGGCPGWAVLAAVDDELLRRRAEGIDRLLDVSAGDLEQRFACAVAMTADFGQNRKAVWERLDLWAAWWRDLLLVKVGYDEAVTNVDRLSELAEMAGGYTLSQVRSVIANILMAGQQLRRNASPRLVFEAMMLDMPRR